MIGTKFKWFQDPSSVVTYYVDYEIPGVKDAYNCSDRMFKRHFSAAQIRRALNMERLCKEQVVNFECLNCGHEDGTHADDCFVGLVLG